MSNFYFEKTENFEKIYNYLFLKNFQAISVIRGMKIYKDGDYEILTNDKNCKKLLFFEENPITCEVKIEKDDLYISCSCNSNTLCEYVFATCLYAIYSVKDFKDLEFNEVNSRFLVNSTKDFSYYYIMFNGHSMYLENNFKVNAFIDFLEFSSKTYFVSMGDMYYNLLVDLVFSHENDFPDEVFNNLIYKCLNNILFNRNVQIMKRLFNLVEKKLNVNRARYFVYQIIEYLNNTMYTVKSVKELCLFEKAKIIYEYVDEARGKEELKELSKSNTLAYNFYLKMISNMNIDEFENVFLAKNTYSMNDIQVLKSHPEWSYETKEKILKSVFENYLDIKTYNEIKEILSPNELQLFLASISETLKNNKRIFDKIIGDVEDINLVLDYCETNDFSNIATYSKVLLANFNKFFIALYKYIRNLGFYLPSSFNIISALKLFEDIKWKDYYICILLKIVDDKNFYFNYQTREYINSIKNELKNKYISNEDFSKLKNYGYNNLSSYQINNQDEVIEFYNAFKDILKINCSYTINPRKNMFSMTLVNDSNSLASVEMNEENNCIFSTTFINKDFILNVLIYFIKELYYKDNSYIENINNVFNKLEEQHKKALEEALKKKSKSIMNDLISLVSMNEITVSDSKIDIEPHILVRKTFKGNSQKYLYLKVGYKKYYIIKNYTDFINNVIYKKDVTYGKNFTFNHNIDSFNERSKTILNLFIAQNILSSYPLNNDHRYIILNDYNFDKIISLSKTIYLDYMDSLEIEVEIANDTIQPQITIDKDYNVYCNDEGMDISKISGKLITGFERDYLLTNNRLYNLSVNKDTRSLVNYILKNESLNIKYVKNSFKKEIYARFIDKIDVDEEIKEEFKLKDLNIKVYFNYEDDIITYKDEFYLEDNKIGLEELKKEINLVKKYSIYENIINNFGFVENKLSDLSKIYQFLRADLSKLREVAEIFLSDEIKLVETKDYKKSSINLGYDSGLLDVCFEDSIYTEEELYKIMSSLKKKVRYIKLHDNVIVKVDEDNKDIDLINEFDLNIKTLKHKQQVPLYQSLKLIDELDFSGIKIESRIKNMLDEISNYKTSNYDVLDNFKSVMRDYQIDAFKWIKVLSKYSFSGVLADDMGLGKSLEIISVIASDEKEKPSLIVCPKSLIYNWENEFKKWHSNINIYPVTGTSKERNIIMSNYLSNKKMVFVISYDSLKNDLELFKKFDFRYLILDEAQFIKNHTTLKAQSVKTIRSELRFALTGTPIENSVVDLWSIFDFLMPKYLYNYSHFKQSYEKNIVSKDEETINKLVKKVTPFILRRTKEQVLKDLPEKNEVIRVVDMLKPQRKFYESQLLKTRLMLKEKNNNNKIQVLSALTRLRQLCVNPGLFIDEYTGGSCKYEAILDIIDEYIEKHKIIIFSQFTQAFKEIEILLDNKKIKFEKITGETSSLDRVEIAERFNTIEEFRVLLVSLKAGGTGLNLIGADIVVHLDPWWNVAAQNQASDRAHRIGQTNVVQVIKIICKNSIEQKVIELQDIKKDLVESIIATDDSNIQKLSESDLKYLLE